MPTFHFPASSLREVAEPMFRKALANGIAVDTAHVLVFDSSPWRHFFDDAQLWLSPLEQQRACRFHKAEHRETYVLAHALWRLAIATVLEREVTAVGLATSPSGQPLLPDTPYATSLSHSGSYVAIALARARCVGVDIEQAPPRPGLHALVSVLCAPSEAQAIEALPVELRDEALLHVWTRKEALLKAFGVGLREAPNSIAADAGRLIDPPPTAPQASACLIHALPLPDSLSGALAAPATVTRLAVHVLPSPGDRATLSPTISSLVIP